LGNRQSARGLLTSMTALGHDQPIEASHGRSALQPAAAEARPKVSFELSSGRAEAKLCRAEVSQELTWMLLPRFESRSQSWAALLRTCLA
jgi:hypothetical protein